MVHRGNGRSNAEGAGRGQFSSGGFRNGNHRPRSLEFFSALPNLSLHSSPSPQSWLQIAKPPIYLGRSQDNWWSPCTGEVAGHSTITLCEYRVAYPPPETHRALGALRSVRSFRKSLKKPLKTVICLLAENEERLWNQHPTWESEGRVEHDVILWLNCWYSEARE